MSLRLICLVATFLTGLLSLSACRQETEAQRQHEANTAAGKAGQVAHRAAEQAGKASEAVGRQLRQAAHDAHEGWKEDARKTKAGPK